MILTSLISRPGTLSAASVAFGAGNGTLIFNHTSGSYVFAPAISGNGRINVLAGTNHPYRRQQLYRRHQNSDGTILQLGNGRTSGSIVGNVVSDGLLAVNRSDTLPRRCDLGPGSFHQIGAGTTILTGANTYTGGTEIGGVLQIGHFGFSGSIVGNVVNDGILAVNRLDTVTFGGVISGHGFFHQIGPGMRFTGANTYTGGTGIRAGVLQIGDGGASGSIVGNVLDNGVLAVNRSDTFSFGGVISGTGAFEQNGAGATTLTATSTYSGATTVNAGMLIVDGSIASSAVTVNAGATLSGSGTVGGVTVNSGATFAPGPANAPGTMTVGGNLAFQSGALYVVQVNATTDANVTASGSATLAGTARAVFAPGTYLTKNYTILHAAGGRSTFGSLTTTNLPSAFSAPELYRDADS